MRKLGIKDRLGGILDVLTSTLYATLITPKISMDADYVNNLVINLLKRKNSQPFFYGFIIWMCTRPIIVDLTENYPITGFWIFICGSNFIK